MRQLLGLVSQLLLSRKRRLRKASDNAIHQHLPIPHSDQFQFSYYHTAILSNVLPDVSASAACVRTRAIMEGLLTMTSAGHDFKQYNNNVKYVTTSAAKKQAPNSFCGFVLPKGATLHHLSPNRTKDFHDLFGNQSNQPNLSPPQPQPLDMALFDRFYTEEQFSFRFFHDSPKTAMILDMQDLHALRRGRQGLVKSCDKANPGGDPLACLSSVVDYLPPVTDTNIVRELSSIHRCDLTLVCSPYELDLLQYHYDISKEKLCLAPFFVDETIPQDFPLINVNTSIFPQFVFCGGFKHDPNVDAVHILLNHVWPRLRSEQPRATLHIYGAHCPSQLQATNHHANGVVVHGYVERLEDIFGPSSEGGPRILLAPLRFGAGIKGKIIDAWTYGMPVITTPVGSEGMTTWEEESGGVSSSLSFGGSVASTLDEFCHAATTMATDATKYHEAQQTGRVIMQELYSAQKNWRIVEDRLHQAMASLEARRERDTMRAILWHNSNRSTDYFSRWVELKESSKKK
ncbi:glycosyl transferase group 1 protein [Nitzschia inconspicua]|uniref:Glycosyl transferase group 1 protein n=1 Tax=Nitzschia inconspicua TaxID=303405 RepID=A0A9K3Q4K4_9STRA|nr:glycosyl transferase group 1 protein [Nitzschia inconspicua]